MEINKIKVQNVDFDIRDTSATKTVELTQAQYDALATKDPNTLYIITDATGGDLSDYYDKDETDDLLDTKLDVSAYTPTDLSNYYTKSETSGATQISTALNAKADTATTYTKTEIDTALGGKQATLVSGTNIKTINNESILGSGNITIEGGGTSYTAGDGIDITNDVISVTGKVDTTAITTSMSSTSTNTQVPSAKAVYDKFDEVESVAAAALNDLDEKKLDASAYTPTDLTNYYNKTEVNGLLANKVDTTAFSTYSAATEARLAEDEEVTAAALNDLDANKTDTATTDALNDVVTAHTANTTVHINSLERTNWNGAVTALGGLKLVKLTQAQYDALATKDANTLYIIV